MLYLMAAFTLLTLLSLTAALSERVRGRLLRFPGIRRAEASLKTAGEWALRHERLLVFLLFAVGVFVRVYRFAELPRGQNQDGTMAAVESFCLLRGGVDHLGHPWPTYFEAWGGTHMSTLYSYILIPFMRLLGMTKFSLRLPMLLVSCASLLVFRDLAKQAMGRGFGMIALFAAAVNPWQILQSRWALEANLMPHTLLFAVWLLYLGRDRKWALYLSMVFFGLTPYAYGVASFVTPVLLLLAAGYFLVRRYARGRDGILCVILFLAVAGPYFLTLAIQIFDLPEMRIGPFSLPHFANSMRSMDLPFSAYNPYQQMISNLGSFLRQFLYNAYGAEYNAIPWAHTMYPFAAPVYLSGFWLWWKRSRESARMAERTPEETRAEDLFRLTLFWLLGAAVNGMLVPGVVNRQNAVFYPLMLFSAYGLFAAGKRLRLSALAMLCMLAAAFAGLNCTYFRDAKYQDTVAKSFHEGLQEALTTTRNWDCDHYYLLGDAITVTQVMFAHELDYATISEEHDLPGLDGQPSGWYFNDRYIFVEEPWSFEPNPTDCAVYVFIREWRDLFDETDYEITGFGGYCAAYPRYWLD